MSGHLEALMNYGQADMDGIIVTVSRQAIHETHDEVCHLRSISEEMLAALLLALPYVETAEADEGYKPGAVAKVSAAIRAAIAKAEGKS